MNRPDFIKYTHSAEFREKLEQYEEAVSTGVQSYFDVDDLVDICEYFYNLRNEAEQAAKAARYCLSMYPDEEIALFILARVELTEHKDADEAMEYLEQVDDYMDNTEGVLIYAEVLLMRGQLDEALTEMQAEYDKLLRENEDIPEGSAFDTDDIEQDDAEDLKELTAEYPLDVAMLLCDYDHPVQAEQWMGKLNGIPQAKEFEYWETWGRINLATNRLEQAIEAINKALDEDSYSVITWLQLCDAQYQLGRIDDTLSNTEFILALDAKCEDAWSYRGCCMMENKRFQEARDCFNKVLEINPDNVRIHLLLAAISLEEGDTDTAMNGFNKAIFKSGLDPEVITDLGMLLYDMGFVDATYRLFKIIFSHFEQSGDIAGCPERMIRQLYLSCLELGKDDEAEYYKLFIPFSFGNNDNTLPNT